MTNRERALALLLALSPAAAAAQTPDPVEAPPATAPAPPAETAPAEASPAEAPPAEAPPAAQPAAPPAIPPAAAKPAAEAEPEVPPEAPPEDELVVGFTLGTALRINTHGAIDLAELAGATGYGSQNDASPASLGLVITLGAIVGDWEILGDAAINFGGLALADIEERYLESEPQPVGGTSTAWLNLGVRHLFRLGTDVELAAGLGAGSLVMAASSPAGGAIYRTISVGPEAEIRYRLTNGDSPGGGWLGLGLDGRLLIPVQIEVGSGEETYFALDGTGDANWFTGGGIYYRYDWR